MLLKSIRSLRTTPSILDGFSVRKMGFPGRTGRASPAASERDAGSPQQRSGVGKKRACALFTRVLQIAPGLYKYGPMNCRNRRCSRCAPANAQRLERELHDACFRFKLSHFLTLTPGPTGEVDPRLLRRNLRSSWAKFRTYLRRRFGRSISFIAILELSDGNTPHLHVLIEKSVEYVWLVKVWTALGGGPQLTVSPIYNARGLCAYLAKQLAETEKPLFEPGTKRVTTSHNIHLASPQFRNMGRILFRPYEQVRAESVGEILDEDANGFVLGREIPR